MSVYGNGQPAYMNDPIDFDLDELFSPAVSVEEHQAGHSVVIYPNPASKRISFGGIPAGSYIIEMLNSNGVSCLKSEMSSITDGLDVSALPAGIYTLRLVGSQQVFFGKVIITR